jgi:hypothetical protein
MQEKLERLLAAESVSRGHEGDGRATDSDHPVCSSQQTGGTGLLESRMLSTHPNPAAGFATPETPVVFEAVQEGQEEQEIVEAEKEAQKAERQPINGLGQQRLTVFLI